MQSGDNAVSAKQKLNIAKCDELRSTCVRLKKLEEKRKSLTIELIKEGATWSQLNRFLNIPISNATFHRWLKEVREQEKK